MIDRFLPQEDFTVILLNSVDKIWQNLTPDQLLSSSEDKYVGFYNLTKKRVKMALSTNQTESYQTLADFLPKFFDKFDVNDYPEWFEEIQIMSAIPELRPASELFILKVISSGNELLIIKLIIELGGISATINLSLAIKNAYINYLTTCDFDSLNFEEIPLNVLPTLMLNYIIVNSFDDAVKLTIQLRDRVDDETTSNLVKNLGEMIKGFLNNGSTYNIILSITDVIRLILDDQVNKLFNSDYLDTILGMVTHSTPDKVDKLGYDIFSEWINQIPDFEKPKIYAQLIKKTKSVQNENLVYLYETFLLILSSYNSEKDLLEYLQFCFSKILPKTKNENVVLAIDQALSNFKNPLDDLANNLSFFLTRVLIMNNQAVKLFWPLLNNLKRMSDNIDYEVSEDLKNKIDNLYNKAIITIR